MSPSLPVPVPPGCDMASDNILHNIIEHEVVCSDVQWRAVACKVRAEACSDVQKRVVTCKVRAATCTSSTRERAT
jgi:hypothetical protein